MYGQVQIKEAQIKKTIVVIGRMGHGKSAFTKMLVREQDKHKIIAGNNAESVTKDCKIYLVDPNLKLTKDDLYVIDTPGLDSNASTFLTVEMLENYILQNNCQIVGLMYVLDMGDGREFNSEGRSNIFTFLKNLKLKLQSKLNIFSFIISKWDIHYRYQKKCKTLFQTFSEIFKKTKLGQAWQKRICWMSEPQQDFEVFQKELNDKDQLRNLYQNQRIQIKNKIQNIIQNNLYVKMQDYINDLKLFDKQIIQNLESLLLQECKPEIIKISYDTKKKQFLKEGIVSSASGIGIGVGTYATITHSTQVILLNTTVTFSSLSAFFLKAYGKIENLGQINWNFGGTEYKIGSGTLTHVNGGFTFDKATKNGFILTAGIATIGLIGYGLYKLFSKQLILEKSQKKKSLIQYEQNKKLLLYSKIKALQLCQLQKIIKTKQLKLLISQSNWIDGKISCALINSQGKKKNVYSKKIQLDHKFFYITDDIEPGKLQIEYKLKTPTIAAFEKFNQIQIEKIYGSIEIIE